MGWVGLGGNRFVESVTCNTTTCRGAKMVSKGSRPDDGSQAESEKKA